MSVLPNRTSVLVKDLRFQKKYKLTHSQTDLMSYILNLHTWAKNIDGYYLLTTSKIEHDLELTVKTIEAILTQLKKLNLITTKLQKAWDDSNKNFRTIKVTKRGREYNKAYIKPKDDQLILDLEAEISKKDKTIHSQAQEIINLTQKLEKAEPLTPKKQGEEKSSKNRANSNSSNSVNKELISDFKNKIKQEFRLSEEIICNEVSGWVKECEFYINSYGNLTYITPNDIHKQINDPKDIEKFWEYLYKNQNQIGKVKDFNTKPNISTLLQYLGISFSEKGQTYHINNIISVIGGVQITIRNEKEDIYTLKNKNNEKIHDFEDVKKWLAEKSDK